MAKVVVTGSQGFLGYHLTKRLVSMGEDVCATYSYNPPLDDKRHNLSYFRLDVTRYEDCLKLINQEDPKILIHLVAQPLVTPAVRHPFSTYELTVRGAYNLLESIRQTGRPDLVVVYTSDKVYGENADAIEGDRIDTVSNPYEVAKTCEDLIARSYANIFGLPIVIIRSGNLYGGGDLHWDRLVPSTCRSLIYGEHPVLRSDGKQKRDYIYIDDAVDGIMTVMEGYLSGKLGRGSSVNFGSDVSYSVLNVVNKLVDISGLDLSPIILGTAENELDHQHINFDLAKSLGWYPRISIDDGLNKTFSWYKDWFSK